MKLSANGLAVKRGERTIFGSLSFDLGAGEAIVVTGPNGSGKSTLLKAVAGLLSVAEGELALEGAGDTAIHEHCHYLAHNNALKPALTVEENLEFWRRFLGPGAGIDDALAAVDLPGIGDVPAGFLSAGQKRRVAIARLVAAHRPVWLVDEPTAALDAASEKIFAGLVQDHLASGGMVLAATHQPLGIEAGKLDMRDYVPQATLFEDEMS